MHPQKRSVLFGGTKGHFSVVKHKAIDEYIEPLGSAIWLESWGRDGKKNGNDKAARDIHRQRGATRLASKRDVTPRELQFGIVMVPYLEGANDALGHVCAEVKCV